MTDNIVILPAVHVVLGDVDRIIETQDINNWLAESGRAPMDLSTISDPQLVTLLAGYLDKPDGFFRNAWVTRPQQGSIVVMEKPSYG